MLARVPWTPPLRAKPKARRLNKDRRRHLVENVVIILKTGEPTRFALEGSCRHGLRAGLCLDGWKWQEADEAAAEIVTTALKQIGAQRPTWAEGQPEWQEPLTERLYCARCKKRLPPPSEDHNNGIPRKYCSRLCLTAASHHRARLSGERMSRAERIAQWTAETAKRRKERVRPCERCGEPFLPTQNSVRFCSVQCAAIERAKVARKPDQPCLTCGEPFHAKGSSQKYCSMECRDVGRRGQHERMCPVCLSVFTARRPSDQAVTCSRRCGWQLRRQGKAVARSARIEILTESDCLTD